MSSIAAQGILMAIAVTVNRFASSNVQSVHKRGGKSSSTAKATTEMGMGRRGLLLSTVAAAPQVSDSGTQLLQKYLKKSEENKAKNDKERMDSYYKRNYKDYFEFESGALRAKKGQLSDAEKGVLQWLDANK